MASYTGPNSGGFNLAEYFSQPSLMGNPGAISSPSMDSVMGQSVLSAPPGMASDPTQYAVQQSVSRKPMPIPPLSTPPAPAQPSPAQPSPAQPAPAYGWDQLDAMLGDMEPYRASAPGLGDQIGAAVGTGLGALAQPIEMLMSPVTGLLETLGASPFGQFGSGFAQGVGNYDYGGFGLQPGQNQPMTQLDPVAIQAEIDRLQALLAQGGGMP
jgi:hypothetical protein